MFFFLNISPSIYGKVGGSLDLCFFWSVCAFLFLFLGGKAEWDLGEVFYGKMFKRLHFFFYLSFTTGGGVFFCAAHPDI